MKKVAIILAIYNGEKYLREQLDSIISQTYNQVEIFIHDDGSTDNSNSIIKEYELKFSNIHVLDIEPGCHYPRCFIEILRKVDGFDYYSFSDQDDVWLPNKIKDAVDNLSEYDESKPVLYYTSVNYCNEKLEFIRKSRFACKWKNCHVLQLQTTLFGGEALGMTYVFNNNSRKALIEANEVYDCKDWFLKLYCSSCGVVVYNPLPSALYRRHTSAVTNDANPSSKIGRYKGQFKEIFLKKDTFNNQKNFFCYMYDKKNLISKDNMKLFNIFSKKSFINYFRKLFMLKRYRKRFIDELAYRLAIMFFRI